MEHPVAVLLPHTVTDGVLKADADNDTVGDTEAVTQDVIDAESEGLAERDGVKVVHAVEECVGVTRGEFDVVKDCTPVNVATLVALFTTDCDTHPLRLPLWEAEAEIEPLPLAVEVNDTQEVGVITPLTVPFTPGVNVTRLEALTEAH